MRDARASFMKGRAVRRPSRDRLRAIDASTFLGEEGASGRATCTRRTNNRPCKDGRHEILAGCRRRREHLLLFLLLFAMEPRGRPRAHVPSKGFAAPPTPPPPSSSCGAVGLSHAAQGNHPCSTQGSGMQGTREEGGNFAMWTEPGRGRQQAGVQCARTEQTTRPTVSPFQ